MKTWMRVSKEKRRGGYKGGAGVKRDSRKK